LASRTLQKKEDKMAVKESDQLNELVGLMRDKWQDNAVEAFAGLLSTFVSEKQLQVLIDDLRQK
jgi:phosphopantetheine adenylyltransferase